MHLVDDIYFIFSFRRTVLTSSRISRMLSTPLFDAASISITFMELPARSHGRLRTPTRTSVYRMFAVDCFCKYLGNRRLTGSPCSAEQSMHVRYGLLHLILKRPDNVHPVLLHLQIHFAEFRYNAVYDILIIHLQNYLIPS